MGSVASLIFLPDSDCLVVKDKIKPTDANWITTHAIATELSIAETERLWFRFRQLGCNKDGVITDSIVQGIKHDAFVKGILKMFLSSKKKLTFENFLRGMKWCEAGDTDTKLRAIFNLLGSAKNVTRANFIKVLELVYNNPEDKKAIPGIADVVFQQMDSDKNGNFSEKEFIDGIKRAIPEELLQQVLEFEVLPNYMRERLYEDLPEFQMDVTLPSGETSAAPSPSPSTFIGRPSTARATPSDRTIRHLTDKIYTKDLERLSNKLGLTKEDHDELKNKSRDNKHLATLILVKYREKSGGQTNSRELERALRDAGMIEASQLLAP
ncbi:uncharacterized protein LOC132551246 [Ylistrum balloti]|uniref:uncharacterized protein LOC132551246 n=1 Tax=Ylistrum balloti TaxID=509963 RepID=UPI002905B44A|nr:uncharacterized protein LOC132551246 [Ylistrum balloti]